MRKGGPAQPSSHLEPSSAAQHAPEAYLLPAQPAAAATAARCPPLAFAAGHRCGQRSTHASCRMSRQCRSAGQAAEGGRTATQGGSHTTCQPAARSRKGLQLPAGMTQQRTCVLYREGCSQHSKTPCAKGHASPRLHVPFCSREGQHSATGLQNTTTGSCGACRSTS